MVTNQHVEELKRIMRTRLLALLGQFPPKKGKVFSALNLAAWMMEHLDGDDMDSMDVIKNVCGEAGVNAWLVSVLVESGLHKDEGNGHVK